MLYSIQSFPARWIALCLAIIHLLNTMEMTALTAVQQSSITELVAIVIVLIAGAPEKKTPRVTPTPKNPPV